VYKTIESINFEYVSKYSISHVLYCFLINFYVQAKTEKYIPPHIRDSTLHEDAKKQEQLKRLQRQMKGLLNRLAENNMNSIASQVAHTHISSNSACSQSQACVHLWHKFLKRDEWLIHNFGLA
jgi:hypothetical protein